ncbi:MAG: orotate phosphoribosyltransferase [Candidatus Omnitrophota bacterium]
MREDWSHDQQRLFDIIKRDAFFRGEFTLSSGKKSNYYLDCRRATLTGEGAYYTARIFLEMVKDETFDAIGGPTLGADPMIGALGAVSVAEGSPVRMFIIRKQPKGHGRGQMIEGPELNEGARVVLIDDVATTGKAFIHSLDVLEEAGIETACCLCIVDRGEGAAKAVEDRGGKLVSIFTAEDFLNS